MSSELRALGRVVNPYSNFLEILVIDGSYAPAYDPEADFERACESSNRGRFSVGEGTGVLAAVGGCGVADVYEIDGAFVIPETYSGDDDADAEAERERVIAMHPTTSPTKLGTVQIDSGVLVMMGLLADQPLKKTPRVSKKKPVAKLDVGVAIHVEPGAYDVWGESFRDEPEGAWGVMPARLRIVPKGTKVKVGAPIATLAASTPQETTAASAQYIVPAKHKWEAVSGMAFDDEGRVFAAESGRVSVAAWDQDGTLLWHRRFTRGKPTYEIRTGIQWIDGELVVHRSGSDRFEFLNPDTGKTIRKAKIPSARTFVVVDDEWLVLRTGIHVTLLTYPELAVELELDDDEFYTNMNAAAVSPNRKWFACFGPDCHVFDWDSMDHVRTIERGDQSSWRIGFTGTNKLVVATNKSRIDIHDPRTGQRLARIDAAPERKRKPAVTSLAAHKNLLAVGRDDGTVALIDIKTKKVVQRFEKHHVKVPGTGSMDLEQVAFSADGKTLWVSAGLKGKPVGLSSYAL